MKKVLSVAASAALALGGLALTAPSAAADVMCTSKLGATTIDNNVQIPAGASCTISGTTIDGNIIINTGARVVVQNARVDGNIQAKGHSSVVVTGTSLTGSIQLENGGAATLSGNIVGGDVQLFSNPTGAKSITNNRIDGNLQCKSNTPPPTGSGNVVKGNAEDQCRSLSGGSSSSVDIYITPGTHYVNGRTWRTKCEPYSQTKRCRTDIWATQTLRSGSGYVTTTGWVFNNLTYAASPRSLWTSNPLGAYGRVGGTTAWKSADGRNWRTECDSVNTGRGGCRSWATATVVERVSTSRGYSYRTVTKEIFNNMVRFS